MRPGRDGELNRGFRDVSRKFVVLARQRVQLFV
jgi:hypothetical protein